MIESDIRKIQEKIKPVLGEKAWGVSLGVGSFVTLEFGDQRPPDGKRKQFHGEWHLWVYDCAWRLDEGATILAASEDSRDKLELAIQYMEGRILHSVDILPPALETRFNFDGGIVLHLFPVYSEEVEHWMLYTPDGNVLTIGPGNSWSYESSSTVSV